MTRKDKHRRNSQKETTCCDKSKKVDQGQLDDIGHDGQLYDVNH